MNIDLLRTFIEVAKTRHFGLAAENMYLTQSAVSSRIKHLEETLGVPVFTRQRNNILLTPAGERFLPHAENLIASWQLAIQEAGVPKQKNIQVSLGGTYNLWDVFLVGLLPKLAKKFPNLYIRTEMNPSQHLLRSLLGGRIDAFAVLESPSNVNIDSRIIGQLQLVMVCNSRYKSLQDVPMLGHVFVDWGTVFSIEQARLFLEPVAPILYTGQSQIALEFVLNYRGAAYLPSILVEPYIQQEKLFLLEDAPEISQDIFLVFVKDALHSETLAPVVNFLLDIELLSDT